MNTINKKVMYGVAGVVVLATAVTAFAYLAPDDLVEEEEEEELEPEEEASRLNEKGNKALTAGDLKQALIFFTGAIEKSKTQKHQYLYSRATAFILSGKIEPALQDGLKCVMLKPDWAEGHTLLGAAFAASQKYDQSFECLYRAKKLEPSTEIDARLDKIRSHLIGRQAMGTIYSGEALEVSILVAAKRKRFVDASTTFNVGVETLVEDVIMQLVQNDMILDEDHPKIKPYAEKDRLALWMFITHWALASVGTSLEPQAVKQVYTQALNRYPDVLDFRVGILTVEDSLLGVRKMLREELERHPEGELKVLIISYITMVQKWMLSLPITPGHTEISMNDIMDDCAQLLSHSTSRALSVIQ
ncbi:stress-induced-phosphoprotein 1-like, partial [Planoprotostelium fungivorum]